VQADKPVEAPTFEVKGYVFLSYSEENREFVAKIKNFLADIGYAFWDYGESDRRLPQPAVSGTRGSHSGCGGNHLHPLPSWRRSKWTVKEYLYSEEVGTPVILVRAEQMEPTLITGGYPIYRHGLQ